MNTNTNEPGNASLLRGMWEKLRSSFDVESALKLWSTLSRKIDFMQYRPQKKDCIEESAFETRHGGEYILKNPVDYTYFRLDEKEYYVWQQIDGKRTVQDILLSYFMKYQSLAYEVISDLIKRLHQQFFLADRPVNISSLLSKKLVKNTFHHKMEVLRQMFFQKDVSIRNISHVLKKVYDAGVWIFFNRAAKILYILICSVGFTLFLLELKSGKYSLLTMGNSYSLGVLSLAFIGIFTVTLHELAHAFTTVSYGREVPKGGMLFYFGTPCFYADTSDIWMGTKKQRMAVSWAGPYSEIILASIAAILVYCFPDAVWADFVFKMAFWGTVTSFMNLNPLLELDGYFMLIDWLEIPMLRKKSFTFLRKHFFRKLAKKEKFSREERIYTLFGSLAIIWTIIAIILSFVFLKWQLIKVFQDMIYSSDIVARILSVIILIIFIVPVILSMVGLIYLALKQAVNYLRGLKIWQSVGQTAAVLLILSLLVSLAGLFIGDSFNSSLYSAITSALLLALSLLPLFQINRTVKGSTLTDEYAIKNVFIVSLIFTSFFACLPDSLMLNCPVYLLPSLAAISTILFFAYSFRYFFNYQINLLGTFEKLIIGILMPLSILFALLIYTRLPLSLRELNILYSFAIGLGIMAVALTFPLIISYYGTKFFIPFVIESAGFIIFTVSLRFIASESEIFQSNVTIMIRCFLLLLCACLFLTGFISWRMVSKRIGFNRTEVKGLHRLGDMSKLKSVFLLISDCLVLNFREFFGTTRSSILEMEFNNRSLVSNWGILIKGTNTIDNTKDDDLLHLVPHLKEALVSLRKLYVDTSGEEFFHKNFIYIYDQLYWEEREILNQYLIKNMDFADTIIREATLDVPLESFITSIPLFAKFTTEEILSLRPYLKSEKFNPGQGILKEGDYGDSFYIIQTGKVEVSARTAERGETVLAELYPGDYFGETALLENSKRNATVTSLTVTNLLSIDREDFNRFLKDNMSTREKFISAVEHSAFLRSMPIFQEYSEQQLSLLASRLSLLDLPKNTDIINAEEEGDTFYIIKEGHVEIKVRTDAGDLKVVSKLSKGEYFGEIALIRNEVRMATVTSTTPVSLLTLKKDDFYELITKNILARQNIHLISSRRLKTL